MIAKSVTELCAIINKLKRLSQHLEVNYKKSAIIAMGKSTLS